MDEWKGGRGKERRKDGRKYGFQIIVCLKFGRKELEGFGAR